MSVTIPTASSIKLRFPEFATLNDEVIEFAIAEARLEVSDENWSTGYDVAIVYLTAHYVACAKAATASGGTGGSSGDLSSVSIGRISVTYANDTTNSDADHDDKESTSYGRRYLELVGGNFAGPVIV